MDPLEFIFMGRDAGGNCVGSLKITIHNKSDVKAGRFNNAVKLPTEVKYLEAAGLVAWGIASRSFTVTIPRGTTFNFTAKADVDNEVQESNELDNHRTLPWTCTSS